MQSDMEPSHQNNAGGTKILQYRKIGPRASKTSGTSHGAVKGNSNKDADWHIVNLPPWMADMAEDYVRSYLPVLEADAARKFGHDAVTVPQARPGKNEKLLFPAYDSSTFGRLVKRVTQLNINKLRSMMETEMKKRIGQYDVPKDVLDLMLGHSEEISKKHYNNPQYLKNIEDMTSDLHDAGRLLRTYIPPKRTRKARRKDGDGSDCDSNES